MNNDNSKYREILKGFKPPFHYQDFSEFYHRCGFTQSDVCSITNRSIKTIKRWERENAPIEFYLLIYCAAGYLLSEPFYGFRVTSNALWTGTRITHNYGFSSNELINYSFFNDRSRCLAAENMQLQGQIKDSGSDGELEGSNIVQLSAYQKRE